MSSAGPAAKADHAAMVRGAAKITRSRPSPAHDTMVKTGRTASCLAKRCLLRVAGTLLLSVRSIATLDRLLGLLGLKRKRTGALSPSSSIGYPSEETFGHPDDIAWIYWRVLAGRFFLAAALSLDRNSANSCSPRIATGNGSRLGHRKSIYVGI